VRCSEIEKSVCFGKLFGTAPAGFLLVWIWCWYRGSDRIRACAISAIHCRRWCDDWRDEFRRRTMPLEPAEYIRRIAMLPEPARIRRVQGSVQRGAASVLRLKGSSNELGRSDVA
jgi:uncharacterized membrane protein YbaN (DUF454 family)